MSISVCAYCISCFLLTWMITQEKIISTLHQHIFGGFCKFQYVEYVPFYFACCFLNLIECSCLRLEGLVIDFINKSQ